MTAVKFLNTRDSAERRASIAAHLKEGVSKQRELRELAIKTWKVNQKERDLKLAELIPKVEARIAAAHERQVTKEAEARKLRDEAIAAFVAAEKEAAPKRLQKIAEKSAEVQARIAAATEKRKSLDAQARAARLASVEQWQAEDAAVCKGAKTPEEREAARNKARAAAREQAAKRRDAFLAKAREESKKRAEASFVAYEKRKAERRNAPPAPEAAGSTARSGPQASTMPAYIAPAEARKLAKEAVKALPARLAAANETRKSRDKAFRETMNSLIAQCAEQAKTDAAALKEHVSTKTAEIEARRGAATEAMRASVAKLRQEREAEIAAYRVQAAKDAEAAAAFASAKRVELDARIKQKDEARRSKDAAARAAREKAVQASRVAK